MVIALAWYYHTQISNQNVVGFLVVHAASYTFLVHRLTTNHSLLYSSYFSVMVNNIRPAQATFQSSRLSGQHV